MSQRNLKLTVMVVGMVLVATGCTGGGKDGVKVTGSVAMAGQPQDGARLAFLPQGETAGESRGAATDATGKFEVMLHPGKYKVLLTRSVDKNGKVPGNSDNPDEDYGQLEASGLLRQVFPPQYTQPSTTPITVEIPDDGKELEPFLVEGK